MKTNVAVINNKPIMGIKLFARIKKYRIKKITTVIFKNLFKDIKTAAKTA
jgi:hypothetical protein